MEKFPSVLLFIILLASRACMQARAQALCLYEFALATEACGFSWPRGPREVQPESEPKQKLVPLRDRHGGQDHHRRGHPQDSACCRRLSGIENGCVCQVLARLPPIISRPRHALKLSPMEGCDVEFECEGN